MRPAFGLVSLLLVAACGSPQRSTDSMTWATTSPIEQRCRSGDGAACLRAGTMYQEGRGFDRSPDRAARLFRRGCDLGEDEACYRLGHLLRRGAGVALDRNRAAELFEHSCDRRLAAACVELAEMIDAGLTGVRDERRVAALLGQACDDGDAATCYRLARRYEVGHGVDHDFARAARLHNQACERRFTPGCVALADLYTRGVAGRLDLHRAAELYRFACGRGDPIGCRRLGRAERAGRGLPRDAAAAAAAYQRGCERGDGPSCHALADLTRRGDGVAADPERARTLRERARGLLRRACDGDDPDACVDLASLVRQDGGADADRRAAELELHSCQAGSVPGCVAVAARDGAPPADWLANLDRGCADGAGAACHALGRHASSAGDRRAAADWFQRGCAAGDPASCLAGGLATLAERPEQALAALQRACDLGLAVGCYQHGHSLLARGYLVDVDLAATQLERACAAEVAPACLEHARLDAPTRAVILPAMDKNLFSAIKIWAAAAWADGVVSEEEALAMKSIIQVGQLSETERETALGWLDHKVDLDPTGLAELSDEDKRTLYLSAAQVAAIDREVAAEEKAFLARLRRALELDDATAAEIHASIPALGD